MRRRRPRGQLDDPDRKHRDQREREPGRTSTRKDADEALQLLSETTNRPTRLGDLRVRELLDRYVDWLDDADAVSARRIADTLVEPHIGRDFAALLDPGDVADS